MGAVFHLLLTAGAILFLGWYLVNRFPIWTKRRRWVEENVVPAPPEPQILPTPESNPGLKQAIYAEFHDSQEKNHAIPGGVVTCEVCGTEYQSGVAYCDCGGKTVESDDADRWEETCLELIGGLEEDQAEEDHEQEDAPRVKIDLVQVQTVSNAWKASLMKSYLESHHIPCVIGPNSTLPFYTFTMAFPAKLILYVAKEDETEARELLEKFSKLQG